MRTWDDDLRAACPCFHVTDAMKHMSCICLIYIYWLLEISLSTFKLWIRCAWGTPHFGYSPVVFTFLPGLTLNEPFLFVEIIWKNGHWFPISFFRKMVSNIHRARPRKQKQAKLVDWIWMNGVNANTQAHTHTKKQTNKKQERRKVGNKRGSPSSNLEPDVC